MKSFDILLKNGSILTMDEGNTFIEKGILGIKGDTIELVGPESGRQYTAKKTVDAEGSLILPGLINCHTHAAMTLFRGLADDLPLMEWLNNFIFPAESRLDSDAIYRGSLLACAEMIRSGTTTFCDMYLFEEQVALAAKASGMRCLVGEVLYDFDSPNYGSVENGLLYTESLIERWSGDPLVSIAVEPHTPYTCSPGLLSAASELAQTHDVPLIIHLSETETEITQILDTYGKRPVAHLQSLNLLGPRLIAAHCVHLDDTEMDLLARSGVKVVHNPESNMKLASGVSPVPAMLERGMTIGLGTDGCASNNNLDMFTEMDMASKLHKLNSMDPTAMDALAVLRMATIEGAKCLGMDHAIGSLKKGKKADIIVMDMDKPHLTPMYNPYSHLVYAARGADVKYTIINGRIVLDQGRIVTMDEGEIMDRVRQKSREILKWLGK